MARSTPRRLLARSLAAHSLHAALVLGALALALGTGLPAHGQTWIRDIQDDDVSRSSLAVGGHGRVAVLRREAWSTGMSTTKLTVLDAAGEAIRSFDFTPTAGLHVFLNDALFLDADTLVVCGRNNYAPWMAAIDWFTGAVLWDTTFRNEDGNGELRFLTVNDLGHLIAVGYQDAPPHGESRPYVVGAAPDGSILYRRYLDHDTASSLASTSNGELLVASYDEVFTVTRLSPYAEVLWRRSYYLFQSFRDARVVEAADGSLRVAARVQLPSGETPIVVVKLTASGDLVWQRSYLTDPSAPGDDELQVHAAVATSDGGLAVLVSQPMPAAGGVTDPAVLRLDSDGDVLWYHSVGDLSLEDYADAIEVTPDDGFLVTASSFLDGVRVVRLDSDGLCPGCPIPTLAVTPTAISTIQSFAPTYDYEHDAEPWGDFHVTGAQEAPTVVETCGQDCRVNGGEYGIGTAGTGGLRPRLLASDGVCLGYTPTIWIADVVGGAPGMLWLGIAPASIPAWGGTFLIDPSLMFAIPIGVGGTPGAPGAGGISFQLANDLAPFVGITFHLQAAFADPAGPTGKVLTNAATLEIE